jgi:SWI/SNF-related matrix-associated actin-dependent regulator 1 of chromatin subfamily A
LDELQRTLRETVMVRRLKKDVLTELPPKRRQVIELPANGLARVVEKEQRAEARWAEEINRLKAERDFASANADEAAYEAAIARLREARQAEFTELSRLRHEGAIAKLPKVVDHCLELLEAVDKLIIFAHHHDVVAGLMDELKDFNPVRLTGEDSQAARDAAVQSFQNDPTTRVFVGSIQAAGVGLTLTAASTVVFAELDWVPGNMSQAEDRLHRIGQNDAVLVQHVVLDGSLDAKLAKTLVRKQAILDAALDKQQTAAVMAEDEDEDEIEDADKSTPTLSLSNDEIVAIHADLRTLAAACDGAHARDGAGFNKVDARFGKSLARQERLTQKQAQFAARLLRKYRRQLIGGGA